MAQISTAVLSVSTTAQELQFDENRKGTPTAPAYLMISNPPGATQTVYWGGSDVSTTNGMPIEAGKTVQIPLYRNPLGLYLIAGGAQDVRWALLYA